MERYDSYILEKLIRAPTQHKDDHRFPKKNINQESEETVAEYLQ